MKSGDIRNTFLEFFRSRGHEVLASSSLIPKNDPTLLFTNAGMVQFKSVFLGEESRAYTRAATSQKCMRAGGKHNDLENVGHTARHHTFFEMLGNFSFGDYFKRDAILFAWELLTEVYKLPKDRLWATVYEEDDEAEELWKELTGIPAGRIVRLGAKDNFWQMGDTGPCGPCSEIIIDQGAGAGCGRPECAIGCECDRYLEIWNLVFMQFDRARDGSLNPLPKPSIDTGMGLERLSAVLQQKLNNFDTDIFEKIIADICLVSKKTYGKNRDTDTAIRVIADHIRSITFLLSDGLIPSNEGRGYVLRRIIRRAARYAKSLDIADPLLYRLCESVADSLGAPYPEISEDLPRIQKILQLEEERFIRTLEQGLSLLSGIIRKLKDDGSHLIPGDELFKLYDTYGFPLDIARDVASENHMRIDEPGFHREMESQRTRARASWVGEEAAIHPLYRSLTDKYGVTAFLGYESMEADADIVAIIADNEIVDELAAGNEGEVLLNRTPFYAESGGQTGDTGEMASDKMQAVVLDTVKPADGLSVHKVRIRKGVLRTGDSAHCTVHREKRQSTMRNHTATHLLHASLRNLLGEHVKQAGSYVDPERLRFDFTSFHPLSSETIESLEDEINSNILKNIRVETAVMETQKALESGVIALFGEKYGKEVRVVSVPGVSSELCGGTHVSATGDIGLFKVLSEGSVASGIRRIEAITGREAGIHLRNEEKELKRLSELLKSPENPVEKLRKVLAEMKDMERELEKLKGKAAADVSGLIIGSARLINGVKAVAYRIDGMDQKDLRILADNVRDRLGSGIIVLAAVKDNQASLVAMVTSDLTSSYRAGDILRHVAANAGGRGGGKPDMAQGGTKDLSKLDAALESLYEMLQKAP